MQTFWYDPARALPRATNAVLLLKCSIPLNFANPDSSLPCKSFFVCGLAWVCAPGPQCGSAFDSYSAAVLKILLGWVSREHEHNITCDIVVGIGCASSTSEVLLLEHTGFRQVPGLSLLQAAFVSLPAAIFFCFT